MENGQVGFYEPEGSRTPGEQDLQNQLSRAHKGHRDSSDNQGGYMGLS